jgi:hypothetical protein
MRTRNLTSPGSRGRFSCASIASRCIRWKAGQVSRRVRLLEPIICVPHARMPFMGRDNCTRDQEDDRELRASWNRLKRGLESRTFLPPATISEEISGTTERGLMRLSGYHRRTLHDGHCRINGNHHKHPIALHAAACFDKCCDIYKIHSRYRWVTQAPVRFRLLKRNSTSFTSR